MYIIDVNTHQLLMARKLLSLSQKDVALSVGMSINNYLALEQGKSDPRLSNFKKAVNFFVERNIIFHVDGNVTINKNL